MWHPTDPEAPRRAIPTLSRLAAQGLLDADEAAAALATVPAPGADPSGWAARRAWALGDATAARAQVRRWAVMAIRAALAPLLAAGAPRAALEAATAAADPAAALTPAERRALLRQAVADALAGRGKVQPVILDKVQPAGLGKVQPVILDKVQPAGLGKVQPWG